MPPIDDYLARVRAFVARRVPAEDVDDVMQEVHLRLLQRDDDVRYLSGYLHAVVRSVVTDYHRRRAATPVRPVGATVDPPEPEPEPEPKGGDEEAAREVATWIRPFLTTLPPDLREAVELTELSGLGHAEAAERLGIPRSTLTSRVAKGRRLVRERIEQCCRIELDARRRVVGWERRGSGCADC